MTFEKPSDAFKKLEPMTSKSIAKLKNRYFILLILITKKQNLRSRFFDKCQNLLFISNST